MKERAEQRSRRRLERLNGGMYHFGGMVVFQHVVKVLETLDNSSLVVVVSELARMYSLIVLVKGPLMSGFECCTVARPLTGRRPGHDVQCGSLDAGLLRAT